jgi:uncharacterized protein (TIGR00369 family)
VTGQPDFVRRVTESFARQGLMTTLRAQLFTVEAGRVEIEMPVSPGVSQQNGFVHAGAISSIVDSACGYAALTLMPVGSEVLAVEFKINFVAPGVGERIRAVGNVIKAGNLVTLARGEAYAVRDGQEKLIAVMQATMIRRDMASSSSD